MSLTGSADVLGIAVLIVFTTGLIWWCLVVAARRAPLNHLPLSNRRLVVWTGVLGCAVVASAVEWYRAAPWYYIDCIEDYQQGGDPWSDSWPNALVAMEPRSIDPIIDRVDGTRVFHRGTCLLPEILKRIGEPAHRRLLQRIDLCKTPNDLDGEIATLLDAFHDCSRLPAWITALRSRPTGGRYYFDRSIRQLFPDAPSIGPDNRSEEHTSELQSQF